MSETMRAAIRRRAEQWRQANERQRSLRRSAARPTPEQAFAAALELIRLGATALAGPDPIRDRGVAEARRSWQKLRGRSR